MRRFRSKMIAALTLLTAAAPPPPPGTERVLDMDAPFVTATINGQAMKLRVDFDTPAMIIINPAAVARARLRATVVRTSTEPVKITVSSAARPVLIGGTVRNLSVQWSSRDVIDGDADGVIGPQALPENLVTLRLRAPRAGERTIELPILRADALFHSMKVGDQVVAVVAAPQLKLSIATSAAGAHLAAMQDGVWSGAPLIIRFEWTQDRPGRAILLRRPLDLNGLSLSSFVVATADFRGSFQLPPDEKANADEIVVRARTTKGTAILELDLGQDVLGNCSSISHDKKRRMLTLQCLAPS